MAPVQLTTHSCHHCQRIVFGRRPPENDSRGNSKRLHRAKAVLEFAFAELKYGDEHGCKLCSWILDDEYISRDDAVELGMGLAAIVNDEMRDTLIQAGMCDEVPSFYTPSPEKTLRKVSSSSSSIS